MDPVVKSALQGLEQAEASLQVKLRESETFRSLEAVREAKRELLARLGSVEAPPSPEAETVTDSSLPRAAARRRGIIGSAKTNKSELYRKLAHELCADLGKRVTSRAVVNLMVQRGMDVPDPDMAVRAVSSALSSDPTLENAGDRYGSGYGPMEWSRDAKAQASHIVPDNSPLEEPAAALPAGYRETATLESEGRGIVRCPSPDDERELREFVEEGATPE